MSTDGSRRLAPADRSIRLVPDLALYVLLAAATLFPLWYAPGWPANHENAAFALRTHIYARHFSWLDLTPIWTSIDVAGYGSPMPLLYHKVFYFLSGSLALVLGSTKAALIATIGLGLIIGAAGMHLTLAELAASRLAQLSAGCMLVVANYTVTNWLIRGAMAESMAAMILPWVFRYFVIALRDARLPIGLGISLGLMWLSHSALTYYAALLLGVALLVCCVLGLASWSTLRPQTAWPALAAFAVLVVPYLIPMYFLTREYEFSRIVTAPLRPFNQFMPAALYLWDSKWTFGRRSMGLTMQIDLAVLSLAAITATTVLVRRSAMTVRAAVVGDALPFVLVAGFSCALQLFVFRAFYDWVPGAVYLQFPWRLLAVITPSAIVATVLSVDRLLPERRTLILGVATVWMVLTCGAFRPIQYERITLTPRLSNLTFSGFREFEPKRAEPLEENQAHLAAQWRDSGCSADDVDGIHFEVAIRRFNLSCSQPTRLALPLYASPLHVVETDDGAAVPCLSLPGFPGLCGVATPAGQNTVRVRMPTMSAFVRWMTGLSQGSR